MRKYLLLTLIAISFNSSFSHAAIVIMDPAPSISNAISPPDISRLSMKEIQQLVGRKLTIKEKIGVKLFQWKLKKAASAGKVDKKDNTASLALIFSIVGLAAFLGIFIFGVGGLGLLVLLGSLLGLIFGNKAKRDDPGNKKAKAAVTLAWITLGLIVVSFILLVIAFSGASWSFG